MEKSEDDAKREMEELNREIDEAEQEHQEPEPEPEPAPERVTRPRRTKKVRSSAQIAAFEKARAKRAANILKRQQAKLKQQYEAYVAEEPKARRKAKPAKKRRKVVVVAPSSSESESESESSDSEMEVEVRAPRKKARATKPKRRPQTPKQEDTSPDYFDFV